MWKSGKKNALAKPESEERDVIPRCYLSIYTVIYFLEWSLK